MPTSFLSASVLARCGRFAGEPDAVQLAAYFHLTDADLHLIAFQSTPANRLGLALQLGCARFLGTFATDLASIPPGVLTFLLSDRRGRCVRRERLWPRRDRHQAPAADS